jgi:hypothetical protein
MDSTYARRWEQSASRQVSAVSHPGAIDVPVAVVGLADIPIRIAMATRNNHSGREQEEERTGKSSCLPAFLLHFPPSTTPAARLCRDTAASRYVVDMP